MAKTVHFSVRLDEQLKSDLDDLAVADNRSVGNLVETALRQYVAERKGGDHRPIKRARK